MIDRKFLIHIGFHKTGTTWFQKKYFPDVPDIDFFDQEKTARFFLEPRSLDFDAIAVRERIFQSIDKSRSMTVFSHEGLSGNPISGGNGGYAYRDISERLARTFSGCINLKIVIFIRNQHKVINSCYGQYVRMGGTLRPEDFLFQGSENSLRRPAFSFDHFRYEKLIRLYQSAFGADKVAVFLYEDFAKETRQFLSNFETVLSLPRTDFSDPVLFARVNAGYDHTLTTFIRFMNHFGKSPLGLEHLVRLDCVTRFTRKIAKELARLDWFNKNTYLLSEKVDEYIQSYYGSANHEVADLSGLPLDTMIKHGYPVA